MPTTETPPASPAAPPPPLSGQDINLAASATRRVLIAALEPFDLAFEQWTIINLVGSGAATDEASLRARLARGLQLSDDDVDALFSSTTRFVHRTGDGSLSLTDAGRQLHGQGTGVVADLVTDLYAGFDPDDLARTREILVELTARAEARLGRS